jgi:hypothetical protein
MSTPQSDTPRTEEHIKDKWAENFVTTQFAQGLERELNAALARVRELEADVESIQRKWDSDKWLFAGTLQLLKEAGMAPGSAELIAAAKRAEAQPPAPQYLDRPDKPGWWWNWSQNRNEWDLIQVMPTATGRYDYGLPSIWLPATPPPPPREEEQP